MCDNSQKVPHKMCDFSQKLGHKTCIPLYIKILKKGQNDQQKYAHRVENRRTCAGAMRKSEIEKRIVECCVDNRKGNNV